MKQLLLIVALVFGMIQFSAQNRIQSPVANCTNLKSLSNLDTQLIEIAQGWSYISTYISPQNPDISVVIDSFVTIGSLYSQVCIVKDYTGKVFWPYFDINHIGDIDITKGYQIKTLNSFTLTVIGTTASPESTDLDIPSGWSMISYLQQASDSIDDLFYFLDDNIQIIKNDEGKVWWPVNDSTTINEIILMHPGEGYQIRTDSAFTYCYPGSL